MSLVVDASVIVDLLVGEPNQSASLGARLAATPDLHAPELLSIEVVSAVRRLVNSRRLQPADATAAVDQLERLPIILYAHDALIRRAWELRDAMTPHDALYVALAEGLNVPLLTADGKLAQATGHAATIQLVTPASGQRPRTSRRRSG